MTDINDTPVAREIATLRAENELLRESLKFALCIYRYQLKWHHWKDARGFLQALRRDENYQSARRILVRQGGNG